MRMQDDRNPQRKPAGEIRVKPPDVRRAVQERTFTRWMNVFLQRRDPPVEVLNLFTDIQDGRILMMLLEELSGCKLLYRFRSSSHRIFRLNNISKALAFLDDRHVKLFGIDASGVADGSESVVLNLIWNIILHFQVKEVTGGLQRHSSLSSLSVSSSPSVSSGPSSSDLSASTDDVGSFSCSTLPSKGRKAAREPKYHGKAMKTLLLWVQRSTSKYGVEVNDFGKSWRSGLAFLALIKSINPDLVDLRESLSREPRENIHLAFMIANQSLDVPPLLEPEDVMCSSPDEQSIITYVSMFLGRHSSTDEDHSADSELPQIPGFGSVEPVVFGETLSDDPEAKALLEGLEWSSEQQLWRRWSRRSSGSPRLLNGAPELSSSRTRAGSRRVFQPPSPLDAAVANQEVRLWLEKLSDHNLGKKRGDESRFSLSSEEGSYSVTALDSDEEDAYSYILDLNKEVIQSYNQTKRPVEKVEEETAEELNQESKHLEGSEDEGKHQDLESEADVHEKLDINRNESSCREKPNYRDESERKSKEEEEEGGGGTNDDSDYFKAETEEMENTRLAKDKTEEDGVEEEICEEVGDWKKEEVCEKWGQVREWRRDQEEERKSLDNEREEERRNQNEASLESLEVGVKEDLITDDPESRRSKNTEERDDSVRMDSTKKCKDKVKTGDAEEEINPTDLQSVDGKQTEVEIRHRNLMITDKISGTTTEMYESREADVHHGGKTWNQTFSDGGSSLHSGDVSPSELQILLILWILLYCFLLLPQINL